MTKAEEKDQKEVERASQNLEQLLALHRGTIVGSAGSKRNSTDRVTVQVDARKKDQNMAIFWNLVCEQYFQSISKLHFSFLDEQYPSVCHNEFSSQAVVLHSEDSLRSFVTERVAADHLAKSVSAQKLEQEIVFLHYRLACQFYLPVMSMNPFIDEEFVAKFDEVWREKSNCVARRDEGIQGLHKEQEALLKLIRKHCGTKNEYSSTQELTNKAKTRNSAIPANSTQYGTKGVKQKSKPTAQPVNTNSLDSLIEELESELSVCQSAKERALKSLATDLISTYENLEPDFRSEYCSDKRAMQSEEEVLESVFTKRKYLFKEVLRLEEIQIAESIMFIEELTQNSSPNQSRTFKIQFDETLLNIEMEMKEEELLKLNRLREYSLFAIHRLGPNNPYQYFSFCKELNQICQRPGFEYIHKMSYNYDPQMLKDLKKAAGKPAKPTKASNCTTEEIAMCHHCKSLLPKSRFFQCGKKCKRAQTDPCKIE